MRSLRSRRSLRLCVLCLLLATTLLTDPTAPPTHAGQAGSASPSLAQRQAVSAMRALCPLWAEPHAGLQESGAPYLICVPRRWSGDLLLFAHGYISPFDPPGIPRENLQVGGFSLVEAATGTGWAFAASGYATHGLAVREGLADTIDLLSLVREIAGEPRRTVLVGASQGGLIAVLGVERYPALFDGAIAACAPIGDMGGQVRYLGDARVLFDQMFPDVLPSPWRQERPGAPGLLDEGAARAWKSVYQERVNSAVSGDPARGRMLAAMARIAYDPEARYGLQDGVASVLWYHVVGTNDAVSKLGGQAYDNLSEYTWYRGSDDDASLNSTVARFAALPEALARLQAETATTGVLQRPLVTLHNTGDPVVPFWHASIYAERTAESGALGVLHQPIAIDRVGHCNVTSAEILDAMERLLAMIEAQRD